MIDFDFEIISDNSIVANASQSKTGKDKVRKLFNKAVKYALGKWHRTNIDKHFSRYALTLYPEYKKYYNGIGKNRNPLEMSGNLHRNVKSDIKVTTSRTGSAKGVMRIGRPKDMNEDSDEFRALVVTEMENSTRDYKSAEARVRRNNSYSKGSIARFNELIGTMNAEEEKTFEQDILDFIVKGLTKSTGNKRNKI